MPLLKKRTLVSFDFDHDEDLRNLFVGQARHPDTPFEIADWSLREAFTGDWKAKIRARIRQVDTVVVLCGEHTHTASGVAVELEIAREEGIPYFLLKGRADRDCYYPTTVIATDYMYDWTWENLKLLFAGRRLT